MGKTYRRKKNIWDDDPEGFERRSSKHVKKWSKQQRIKKKTREVHDEQYNRPSVHHR
tara:strand:+ start:431 stop:601 length:171 start_codon:yes stop_codon:yes gene_type:complete